MADFADRYTLPGHYPGEILPGVIANPGVKVLLGYDFWFADTCAACGSGYACVEAGEPESKHHVIRCWCGATTEIAYDAPELHAALQQASSPLPRRIACPACGEVELDENDLRAQIDHMSRHPEYLAERERRAAAY